MTVNPIALRGRRVELSDGSRVTAWIEEDDREITVAVSDGHGRALGRYGADRAPGHAAARLSAWTTRTMRGRGLALAGLRIVVEWAQAHRVPFLVGDIAADDEQAKTFLARSGYVVARRSEGDATAYALLVPSVPRTRRGSAATASAVERAALALEAGASAAEADELYEKLLTSAGRHPSTWAA